MWLLGNLFRTETWLDAFFAVLSVDLAINEGRNALASTENYGILGDAIPVADEFSDSFADLFNLGQSPTLADQLEQACRLQSVRQRRLINPR